MTGLNDFIDELTAICSAGTDALPRAVAVRAALARRLERRDWMPRECQRPDPEAYHPEILHVDKEGSFSLVAMTWLPGQRTPIHDHVAWCVVGIYSGEEQSFGYSLHRDDGGEYLAVRSDNVWRPGDTDLLVPPDQDIHEVSCCGEGTAVSLHVYGAAIRVGRTSVNRRFDHLPIRADAGGASLVWRPSRPPEEMGTPSVG